jgi:hypothetical protein
MGSHYDTLGVKPSSSTEEIRKGYLRRARALHPDRQHDRPADEAARAEQAMRQVNEAWSVLSNPKKKAAYDQRARSNGRAATQPARVPEPARRPDPRIEEPEERPIDREPGDGSISVLASVPVMLIIGLLLGIVIVTAFANKEPTDNRPVIQPEATGLTVGDCFTFVGEVPRIRSCSTGAEATVVAVVPAAGNCPQNSMNVGDPSSDFVLCYQQLVPGSAVPVAP